MKKIRIDVPIYEAVVWLVVDSDIVAERKKMEHWFGPFQDLGHVAICSYASTDNFALFFTPPALEINIISHEVFHLTHRILDFTGVQFDRHNHEAAAHLHGWLMDAVITTLKKSKIKIKNL